MLCLSGFELYSCWVPLVTAQVGIWSIFTYCGQQFDSLCPYILCSVNWGVGQRES